MDRSVLIKWMPGLSCSKNIWSKEKNVLFVTPKGSCSKISIFCFGENIVESSPYFCRGKKIMSLWLTLSNTLGGQEAHQPQSMGHGWNGRLWHTSTTFISGYCKDIAVLCRADNCFRMCSSSVSQSRTPLVWETWSSSGSQKWPITVLMFLLCS